MNVALTRRARIGRAVKTMLQERRKLISVIVVALAVVGALAFASSSMTTKAEAPTETKTLSVTGNGVAVSYPDTYLVWLNVVGEDVTSQGAMEKANALYEALSSALEAGGYNSTCLTLSSVNVYPVYYYPKEGQPVLTGYRVVFGLQYRETTEGASPKVLGTRAAGVVQVAVSAGVNEVYGVSFTLSDASTSSLKEQALAAASTDARQKAQTVASSLGVQVLGVKSAQVVDSYYPPILVSRDALAGAQGGQPEFTAGPISLTARVDVAFIIG